MLLTLYTLPQLAVSAKILCLLMVVICGAVPSMVRSVTLFNQCSHGYLRIYPNGTVMAKDDDIGEQYQNLTISSENLQLKLLIYSPTVGRYLCYNKRYKLLGMPITKHTALQRPRCQFYEEMSEGYSTYKSVADGKKYITLNRQGGQLAHLSRRASAKKKCRGFIKKDNKFSIKQHNIRIGGAADVDFRPAGYLIKSHVTKRPKMKLPKHRHAHYRQMHKTQYDI